MAEYLLDTNVLSKIFYGDSVVKRFVDSVDAGIESIVYIECIQGSISKRDKTLIRSTLDQLPFYPLNQEIGTLSIELVDKYSASKGLFLADSFIAATAIYYDLTLITYNIKHFKFISELSVIGRK